MDQRLTTLLSDLSSAERLSATELLRASRRTSWLVEATPEELAEFLQAVSRLKQPLVPAADRILATWLTALAHLRRKSGQPADATALTPIIERLYRELGPASRARAQLLAWLAIGGNSAELDALAQLLIDDPPGDDQDVVQALAPLFQRRRAEVVQLFPRLFAALSHPAIAAPVVDLANYLTREKLIPRHPATDRADELANLLGKVVQSLLRMEERPDEHSDSPQELSRRVARGVALAVSLCDALALIGEPRVIGKLNQALDIRHRRVRTEAAAALARLGEKHGHEVLIELAAEPVARLRVLAYAAELGITGRIDPQYVTPAARAEAELSVWLAEPTQYGLPPTSCELFDHCRQHWPGYDDEVDCFLFRFQYVITLESGEERSFSNIGIAGPLAHAFVADLGDLPASDIYAAFAGWQAEHERIRELDVERLSNSEKLEVERLKRRLIDAGFTDIEPKRIGYFFSDKALIALAQREGVLGVAVADFQETSFFPRRVSRPLGPEEVYCIYKGRKLLAAFNR